MEYLESMGQKAKSASLKLTRVSTEVKNSALFKIADSLEKNAAKIIDTNQIDYLSGQQNGLTESVLDRLLLNKERVEAMARDVRQLAEFPDPIGQEYDILALPNGLIRSRRTVPLGVIGAIYESRPHVTVDIAAVCIKSGNSVILRGGSEAYHSNKILSTLVRNAITESGIPKDAVQFVDSVDRALVTEMLRMKNYIDLLIPRGGSDLIKRVAEESTMPSITGGIGVCHTYVDESADLNKAVEIAFNAKVQRPSVCNALDSLLVHSEVARDYLPIIAKRWSEAGVEIHADKRSLSILGPENELNLIAATDQDWGTEFLSLTAAVKVVDSLEEAISHIDTYGSGHSEAIITENQNAVNQFLDAVDAAAVFANASTRFNDGAEFGLGPEVAISTDKMHARGPMGIKELTSYKWIVRGSGQTRP
jgi:glutamate-5-semialdehyde dehydrogenase